jgi:glycosyltransferase involved in cell wall biosynthesis
VKIFIFTKDFPKKNFIGGAEIQAYLLAKYLTLKNHQIKYLVLKGKKGLAQTEIEGFKLFSLSSQQESDLKAIINFYQINKKEKPDLFFIRDFRYLFIFYLTCRFLKIPVIYNTTHINNCLPYPKKIKFSINILATLISAKAALIHFLNFKTLKKVHVITINRLHAEILKTKYNITATPIYNSMEDNYQKFKVAEKEDIIVWVANLKGRKRPEIFLQLAQELKETNFKFLMIGYLQNNIDLYKKLIEETQNFNPNFKYLGGQAVEKVDEILAKAKIFVNTCLPEGFGNNFIQAWLNECPTITLDFDPDDIIKNNKIGFHSASYEQLAKDTKFLITNENTRAEMGKHAREFALKNHLPKNNVLKYENYFLSIINKKQHD